MGLLGLVASLLSWPGHAASPLDQAGALLWEMGEIYTDFGYHRLARGMTPEKVERLAGKVAYKLASRRDELAAVLPGLDPESDLTRELKRFLENWPGRQAFQDELLSADEGVNLGMALGSLKMQAPDTRRHWRTPFPFFRP